MVSVVNNYFYIVFLLICNLHSKKKNDVKISNINKIQISIFRKSVCLVRYCYSNCIQECFSPCYPAFAHQEGRQTLLNKTLIWCLWNVVFSLLSKILITMRLDKYWINLFNETWSPMQYKVRNIQDQSIEE